MDWHFEVQKGLYFDQKVQVDDINIYLSKNISDGFWNYAFVPEGLSSPAQLIPIENFFEFINRSPSIYIIDDNPLSKTTKILTENGYTQISEESFMTYSSEIEPVKSQPSIKVVRAEEGDYLHDFLDIFGSAYGGEKTPEQPYGELDVTYIDSLKRSFLQKTQFYHYLCYSDNCPVSIATLCYSNGKGGLYNVGTSPVQRGKGYGTIATKACIEKWKDLGGNSLFLQTETVSLVEQWYGRLGFRINFIGKIFTKE